MKNKVKKPSAIMAAALAAVLALGFTGCATIPKPEQKDSETSKSYKSDKTNSSDNSEQIIFGIEPDPEESIPFIGETPSYAFSYYYDSDYDGMVVDDYFLQSPKVRIPDTLEGAPVTRVSMQLCQKNLTHLFLPETVKSIWLSGETKKGLEYINVPRDMTCVDGYGNCYRLESIVIPDGATEIRSAFQNCKSLTNVIIPDSVTKIGDSAFEDCTSLTSATYKGKTYDYEHIEWLYDAINLGESGLLIEHGVLKDVSRELTKVVIPDNVTEIGKEAFSGCTNLTSVTIPNSVTKIGDGAFSGCKSLTNITIPDRVTEIGGAFYGCTSLTSATYKGKTYNYEHRDRLYDAINVGESGLLIEHGVLKAVSRELTEVVIPDSVTKISYYAFQNNKSLTSVTIPDSMTEIGKSTFTNCTSLTSVTIPDSVTVIGEYAFENCTSLASVTIPDSVTKIEYAAFQDCTSLTSITIPSNVFLYGGAFNGCPNMQVAYNGKIYDKEHLDDLYNDTYVDYFGL